MNGEKFFCAENIIRSCLCSPQVREERGEITCSRSLDSPRPNLSLGEHAQFQVVFTDTTPTREFFSFSVFERKYQKGIHPLCIYFF